MKQLPQLFKIKAEIEIIHRKHPFISGYTPGFIFDGSAFIGQRSGSIKLLDRKEMGLNEKGIVEIYFYIDVDIEQGKTFSFYEGGTKKGFGRVLEVIGWVTSPGHSGEGW
ncbi:hypothetical protein [Apibacter sp. HY039]|uniref:hypothetical protein n=1 Tax=Apibacter sp. HY039 TaxID=2501476 RepID=UPI000FEB7171|nr:hypothetical protein [Apibacter sp. HY039]